MLFEEVVEVAVSHVLNDDEERVVAQTGAEHSNDVGVTKSATIRIS